MLMAATLVFLFASFGDVLRLQVPASAYQRLASTPPYMFQVFSAFLLGIVLSGSVRNRKCGLWAWVPPTIWMLLGLALWKPIAGASLSVWQYFFTGSWWQLPPSPLRSQWVTAQFTHTVPLLTSVAYALGALLRRHGPALEQGIAERSAAVS